MRAYMQIERFADVVVMTVQKALSPVLERVAAAEARLSVLGDLRDRVVTVETKAALPSVAPSAEFDAAPLLARIDSLEAQIVRTQERIAEAESKALPMSVMQALETKLQAVVDQMALRLEMKSAETAPLLASVADLTKDLTALRERVAVVE